MMISAKEEEGKRKSAELNALPIALLWFFSLRDNNNMFFVEFSGGV